tara:strand:- start:3374 stop:4075 length:702 start_codon:yes stop_codon:yes gene_type:complete
MGFLDHSTNNIILDAVLTDLGREALSRNDGSFSIFKFALSDEEVDYGHIVNFGRTVGKEKIEKNTPILEATTQGNLGQKYRLISFNNDSLIRLPTLNLVTSLTDNTFSVSRNGENSLPTSFALELQQKIDGGGTADPDVTDFSYRVTLDYSVLSLSGAVPDSVDDNNIAVYTVEAASTINSQNLSSLPFTVVARPISQEAFDSKKGGDGYVTRSITVSGQNSGASLTFQAQIS